MNLSEAEARPIEEPGARKLHAGILCGVRRVTGVSTVTMKYLEGYVRMYKN